MAEEEKKPQIIIQISPEEISPQELLPQMGKVLTIVCAGLLKSQMKELNEIVDDFIVKTLKAQGIKVEFKE